ncbi:hypothetical protein [Nonomuraea turcica]|uniref:hypothetical protein n=1 Tax=Nonomuraea sp. G32 TaxID=3067274 RepID=UPI00273CB5FA|nr:hypothetical protein [Nonomuraea sp. G32]MDP4505096.1 hypothetical protein [Nonomuraea sp. G32]
MADISYFEAWGMWLDGRSTLGNDLLGLPMIWWGRAGKILSFMSGAAIVVELVSPETFMRYGKRLERILDISVWRVPVVVFAAGLIAGLLTPPLTFDAPSLLANLAGWVIAMVGVWFLVIMYHWLMSPQRATIMRWVALSLLLIGFHFDLLAS